MGEQKDMHTLHTSFIVISFSTLKFDVQNHICVYVVLFPVSFFVYFDVHFCQYFVR
jgi:hypothetical protein